MHCLRSGASHVSGLFARHTTAGPDVIRRSEPYQKHGLDTHGPAEGSSELRVDRSHHTIITLAISKFSPAAPQPPIAKPLTAVRRAPEVDRCRPSS